jgi:hypothetical protein
MPATAGLATNFYPRQIACASGYRDQAWPAPRLPHRRVRLLLDVGHRRPRPWACGQRRGSSDLQIRTRSCGMDRACAAAEFQRGQGASWGHHQSRQRLSAADGHGRGDGGDPLRPAQQCTPALARPAHGSPPNEVPAIALVNKTARTVWALMSSGERYRDPQASRRPRRRQHRDKARLQLR